VEVECILRNCAVCDLVFPIVTPLKPAPWHALLEEAGALNQFSSVPTGLTSGFTVGLENFTLSSTFALPNHYKTAEHHDYIVSKYSTVIELNHVSPGYPPELAQHLFGNYRTAPNNVVSRNEKFRTTIDHSFPRADLFFFFGIIILLRDRI
jgi:hypothetical protein